MLGKKARQSKKTASAVVKHLQPKKLFSLFKAAATGWNADGAASMGAAIAYYTIFSIAPLLIIIMAIAGFFFGTDAVQGQIYGQAQNFLGSEGATALQGLVKSANQPSTGFFATVISLALMLVGASGVFAELQGAMDKIWQTPVEKKQSGIWYLIRRRILTFGVLLAVAFLLIVSLAISAFISSIQSWWSVTSDAWAPVFETVNFAISFLIITALFASLFRLLPRATIAWGDVVIGAIVTALLFNIGKFLIGLYIGKTAITSGFGAAGSIIAMVIWVYYSAQIFLLGAEFTWVYAKRFGSRSHFHGERGTKASL